MKRLWTVALLACMAVAAVAAQQGTRPATTAAAQFEAAQKKEVVDGDLAAAIQLYRKLADGSDRAVAAKALMRMGQCYEKLGTAQSAEARKAYERLARDFADQRDMAAQARARLAALTPAATSTPASPPGSLRRVYEGTAQPSHLMALSADARYLLFVPTPRATEFVVHDLVTGAETRVPVSSPDASIAEWRGESTGPVTAWLGDAMLSPDHRQIVYSVALRDSAKGEAVRLQSVLRVIDVAGTGSRQVTRRDDTNLALMRWTPDSKSVIAGFDSQRGHGLSVVSIRVSDGALTPLSSTSTGTDNDAVWRLSPDGRFVAIWEMTGAGFGISIADARTGTRSRIAEPNKANGFGLGGWAPDGSGVLLVRDPRSTPGLWFQPLSEGIPQGPPQFLRAMDANDEPLGIGPDGSYYYEKNTPVSKRYVVALDQATGKVRGQPTLIPELENICGYDWSPDGTAIAYGARLNKGAGSEKAPCTLVAIRTVEDGRERIVSPGMSEIRRPRWSPDGKSLAVFGQKDGVFGVFKLDPETNSARLLVEAPVNQRTGDRIPSAEWAPNGKGLFLGRLASDANGRVLDYRLVHRDLESGLETDLYSIKPPAMFWFTTTRVSRDGSLCLLVNEADGSRAAVLVPSGGGPARTVYRVPASSAFPGVAWAADGKSIYVAPRTPGVGEPNTRKLLRVPIDGAEPVDAGLTLVGLDEGLPSPDGKRQFFGVLENVAEIWVIDRLVPTGKAAAAVKK